MLTLYSRNARLGKCLPIEANDLNWSGLILFAVNLSATANKATLEL